MRPVSHHAMRVALLMLLATATAYAQVPPRSVTATLEDGVAHIVTTYTLARTEPGVSMEIVEMPAGGLVTAASVDAHKLGLVEAAAADTAMESVIRAPRTAAPRWAAVIRRSGVGNTVDVQLAVPTTGFAQLVLEISAPTCFFKDERYLAVPESWPHVAAAPDCGEGEFWMRIADRSLISRASGEDRVGAHAGRLALGDTHVGRLELAIASHLGEVPRDLATVIVVDLSRSVTPDVALAQRQLIRAYLARVPDTRVQLIGFARTPHPLLAGWMVASQVAPSVERLLAAEPQRNGSNLDDALAAAQRWLARAPGTHRILIVSDELYPQALQPTALRGILAADTLVNVAMVHPGATELVRDDDGFLGPLAAATYGIRASGEGDVEMLVRPVSLDHLRVQTPGWEPHVVLTELPAELAEGHSVTAWYEGDASSGLIEVDGMIWGRRVSRQLAPELTHSVALARELSAARWLPEPQLAEVDRIARAVNPGWSLFGAWGGKGGYDLVELSGHTGSICGCDRFGTIGHGFGTGTPTVVDDHLPQQLEPAAIACHAERDKLAVKLELTLAETVAVDVQIQSSPDAAVPGALRRRRECLIEAIWNLDLAIALPSPHRDVSVTLH